MFNQRNFSAASLRVLLNIFWNPFQTIVLSTPYFSQNMPTYSMTWDDSASLQALV